MLAKANGRPVFVIEYIKKPENLAFAEARLKELVFHPAGRARCRASASAAPSTPRTATPSRFSVSGAKSPRSRRAGAGEGGGAGSDRVRRTDTIRR